MFYIFGVKRVVVFYRKLKPFLLQEFGCLKRDVILSNHFIPF